MVPEDIVLQLKRNGTFDDLRKKLLAGFQNGVSWSLIQLYIKYYFIRLKEKNLWID